MAGQDWKRLGSYVARKRFKLGYQKTEDLADELGISSRTLGRLETGVRVGRNTLLAVEEFYRWAPGTTNSILAGGTPNDPDLEPGQSKPSAGPDLRDEVERKLWALEEIPEAHRWTLIHVHRSQLEQGQRTQRA